MRIAFYGSSLLSSYWNGAATYYRGMIRALAALGHDITFYEPDAFGRQQNRDIEPPDWCRVVVYEATPQALRAAAAEARGADVVVKTSGVGYADDDLLAAVLEAASPTAIRVFWDVDAPATLAELQAAPDHPSHRLLPGLDMVLTYGGGDAVVAAYRGLGAKACVPIYNALDSSTHHPVPADSRFAATLGFLGNRLPDREARVDAFFFAAAAQLPEESFLLGGSGWEDRAVPGNVRRIGHVSTRDHNAFNVTPRAVLNINRASMAEVGFSPPTRVFEAAGAGACLITDNWPGIDTFLAPGEEILVARDGRDVAELLGGLSDARAAEIGARALRRVLADHTYEQRAVLVDALLRRARAEKSAGVAA
jgi:spore maturation protein CgeB